MSKGERHELILRAAQKFVAEQISKLGGLTLDDLAINPFLVGTLNLTAPEEIVSFFVNQRFQRGVVTAFGSLLEKRISALFAERTRISDIDLKFKKGHVACYVQMKSGPEGFTGPALRKTIETMQRLKLEEKDCRTFIAFAYGTRNKLSKVWGHELNKAVENGVINGTLVGREFWEFVLDNPDGYKIIFDLCKRAGSEGHTNLEGTVLTLENARNELYRRILNEFKTRYGEGPRQFRKWLKTTSKVSGPVS